MPTHALDPADTLVALGRPGRFPETRRLVDEPVLQALRQAGTEHVYADTAEAGALDERIRRSDGTLVAGVDGNTANQPLLEQALDDALADFELEEAARLLREQGRAPASDELVQDLYTAVCGRIGNGFLQAFASGRVWETSLQLHMGVTSDAARAAETGRLLRRMVATAFVKVPFRPDHPATLLVARDLERDGVPVNLTSTFSARQVVVGALLANVSRSNVFVGRIDQMLEAAHVGDHVALEAQRALRRLRDEHRVRTRLIVASMRSWETFRDVAGCDVFTAPCAVLESLFAEAPGAEAFASRLEHSFEDALGVPDRIREALGQPAIARLWTVEPELVEFLLEYRASQEFQELDDADALVERFAQSGFGDLFHVPDEAVRASLEHGKIPELEGPLAGRVPLDTALSLHANADFARSQAALDRRLRERLPAR